MDTKKDAINTYIYSPRRYMIHIIKKIKLKNYIYVQY